jgi:hypothetical protein
MAQKQKFVEGDQVRVKDCEPSALWEVYAVRKVGRKVRYSVKRLELPGIVCVCNIKGNRLKKVEEK